MKSSELLRLLKKDGWYEIRQKGRHITMRHSTKPNQILVPFHASKEIAKGTLHNILKDAELKTTTK